MSIRVIGAGMGRTGTLSLKLALEMLGVGPCYHMMELLEDPSRGHHWTHAWKGRPVDWQALFAGFQSTVDFPGYRHYGELAEVFPEAKVILTVRDPERWWQSTYDTIYQAEPGFAGKLAMAAKAVFSRRHRQLIGVFQGMGMLWRDDFGGRFEDKAYAIERYEAHVAEVKATIPAERLLVMQVADGWGPLCDFLELPEPDAMFPRTNSRTSFHERLATGLDTFTAPKAEPLPGYGRGRPSRGP